MPTHIHNRSLSDGQQSLTSATSKTAEAQIRQDVPVAAAQTNMPIEIAFPFASVASLYLLADAAMTVKTNNSTTPGDTITLAANQPLEWHDVMPYANPITANVTGFFVTNTAAGTLKIRVLYDPTP